MKNDVDNKLTDKGWQSMRVLLNRDMPEQRRRRPFVWWWAAALLLLPLAGAGGWWFYRQSKGIETPPRPIEMPEAPKPVVGAEPNFPKVDNLRKVDTYSTGGRELAYSSDDSKSSDKSFASSALLEQPVTEQYLSAPLAADAGMPGDALAREDKFQEPALFANFNVLVPSSQFVENEIKRDLNLHLITPVEYTSVKKYTDPRRWTFGFTTGLASEKLNNVNGFLAGGTTDFQFARKWGLRSGLQYAQYRSSEEERPIIALDDAQYVEATGNFEVLDDNTINSGPGTGGVLLVQETVLVPIEKFQRLEMPLLAFWNPVRPLRIFGGITGSYILSAKASRQNFSNNKYYYADSQLAEQNLNELTVNALPRWNVDLMFGAGMRLGKHVELDAFFKPGLSKSVSDVALADQNGSFYDNSGSWQPRNAGSPSRFSLHGILFF